MRLDRPANPLLEGIALDPEIKDDPFDLARLARRLVEELPRLQLGLLDDQLRLLAGLLLDVLGQLLGGQEGLLQDPLALLEVGDARLDLRQLLLEAVVVDDDPLELPRHEVEEGTHLLGIEAPHPLREAVPADVDRRDLHAPPPVVGLSPKRARPTRTIVAPSSIPTSKSSDIPIDS